MWERKLITLLDTFGEPFECEGRVDLSLIKQHGFEHEGTWCLYSQDGWQPSFFIPIIMKGKRKPKWWLQSRIVSMVDVTKG